MAIQQKVEAILPPRSIGVIGLGQMGHGIARNLDRAGYLGAAYDLIPEAFESLQLSSNVANTPPRQMAQICSAVLLVVPSSREVASCLLGGDGILSVERMDQILIDLTTSFPPETLKLAEASHDAGRYYVDCGMSGGAMGADSGRLTLMVGGDADIVARCRPIFEAIAAKIIHVGGSSTGHAIKLIHNMILHSIFLATCEGCCLAERAGLDLKTVIDVLNAGNARSFISEVRFPQHILSNRFDGRSFVSTLAKDLGLAVDFARDTGTPVAYGPLTYALLTQAVAKGHGGKDFTLLYKWISELILAHMSSTPTMPDA
jgi:3-hydroxyisobutyrate dehydrogenase